MYNDIKDGKRKKNNKRKNIELNYRIETIILFWSFIDDVGVW